jgi:hypothetical protein
LLLLLLLPLSAAAQDKKKDSLWHWSDAALLGGMVADELTSGDCELIPRYTPKGKLDGYDRPCREGGLIKQPGARIAFKAGLFTGLKFLESRLDEPGERRAFRWFKVALAGAFTAVAIHNARKR